MEVKLENLTTREKIGQMFMVGMDVADCVKYIDELILKYKIGGILLYKKNYNSYKDALELINHIKEINKNNKIPIFIATDQEGGRVNRMPDEFENIPSAHKLAQYKKEDLVSESAQITANMLKTLGFNFNLAPVLDIKRFSDNHAIGDRAYSETPEEVGKYGIEYMKKMQENNILSTIKHFPGHGSTIKDSHLIIPTVKNFERIEQEDMKPFEEAIKQGADCILVSHLKIKGITKKFPTSMNRKFITKYIRKKYRYNGLVITDDMRMRAIKTFYGSNKAVKMAFDAGNDIIIFKHCKDVAILDKIVKEVENNKTRQARVNRSVKRILKAKEKYKINDMQIQYNENIINEINGQILKIREKVNKED